MSKTIQKVTGFVIREVQGEQQLLVFRHPFTGIQIPAGTVEIGEALEVAVLREVAEEGGLTDVRIVECLGVEQVQLPENQRVVLDHPRVYARLDDTSFDWGYFRRGITVEVLRQSGAFTQVKYEELDRVPGPHYVSMSLMGWVPTELLAATRERHFYLLEFSGESADSWTTFTDNHTFTPFWALVSDLPRIIPPQDRWLVYLRKAIPHVKMRSS
ncbi:MAG: NUDIX domain-containing protein [Anaerolineales bacterium]|nr:NUDIX domain-containing protein [Anaerolineales bacterium]